MKEELATISRFLSYVLRHKPESIGLQLDPEGWASIPELISKADIMITPQLLAEVVSNNDKKRFSISPDQLSIRANQGHSINVDLGLSPVQPPQLLFHGTATRFIDSIKQKGLIPKNRQYIHLSDNEETAIKVGSRHGKPIIISIPALKMHNQDHQFFQAENGVWLTTHIKPDFLQF